MAVTTATGATGAKLGANETVQAIYVTGVRNAHALEKEAIQLLERQIERSSGYPDIEAKLRQHLAETNRQHDRIDALLRSLGADRSLLKDWITQLMGNAAMIAHAPMGDEILKNTFASHGFEAFEIAAYKSLIVMAEATGHGEHVVALRQSLEEEQRMARWISDNVEKITRMYLEKEALGDKVDR